MYRDHRTLEKFENFALKKGYLQADESSDIPKKLSQVEIYMKSFNKFLKQLAHAINMLFNKFGLDSMVPP